MKIDRRAALKNLTSFFLASPLLHGQVGLPRQDPLLDPINIWDFKELARKKLDPMSPWARTAKPSTASSCGRAG